MSNPVGRPRLYKSPVELLNEFKWSSLVFTDAATNSIIDGRSGFAIKFSEDKIEIFECDELSPFTRNKSTETI